MAADASIYSLIRQPKTLPDPIQEYVGMAQLKKLIRDDRDQEAANAAWMQSGGDLTKFSKLLSQTGGSYKPAIEAKKAGLEARKSEVGIQKDELSILSDSLKIHKEGWARVTDPQSAARFITSSFNDPILSPVMQKSGSLEEWIKEIPQDHQKFQAWRLENALGVEKYQASLDAAAGRAVQMRGHDVMTRGQDRPIQITDAAGNVRLVNPYTGESVKDLGNVGKPTATHEKTVAANKKLSANLDEAITELEKATKDGGLIDQSTGSGIGAGVDFAASLFGKATKGSIAVGAMKPIFDLALKMVPRFEGPQSDKDTLSYKEAAGELANPNVPNERKKIAGREILRLMKARKGQFISKEMEGTEVDVKPALPADTKTPPAVPRTEDIDAELRRRGVIR